MTTFAHIFLFLASAVIIWFFAGLLVDSVNRVAVRFHKSGFTVAFFVLGLLTSISEISVMVNSTLEGRPGISAGNLVGASFMLILFLIPLFAIVGNGVSLKHTLSKQNLLLALCTIVLPTLFLIDGQVTWGEGVISLLAYGTLLYFIRTKQNNSVTETIQDVEETLLDKSKATFPDILKIIGGGAFIFFAGRVLVEESIFFAEALGIPGSIVGLLILSIGTNVPELVIAIRSIIGNHKDIAFGNYVGSALANTFIFGVLALVNKGFQVESSEFVITSVCMVFGLGLFYTSAISKSIISRREGFLLISCAVIFFVIQIVNAIRIAV